MKLARYLVEIFDFKIITFKHIPGKNNALCDHLSRYFGNETASSRKEKYKKYKCDP